MIRVIKKDNKILLRTRAHLQSKKWPQLLSNSDKSLQLLSISYAH